MRNYTVIGPRRVRCAERFVFLLVWQQFRPLPLLASVKPPSSSWESATLLVMTAARPDADGMAGSLAARMPSRVIRSMAPTAPTVEQDIGARTLMGTTTTSIGKPNPDPLSSFPIAHVFALARPDEAVP